MNSLWYFLINTKDTAKHKNDINSIALPHFFSIGVRNPDQCVAILQSEKPSATNYEVLKLDLMSLASVKDFADKILEKDIPVHVLANNGEVISVL